MTNTKAQFKAMETIFIMIIITMMIVTGYAIYSKISTDNFETKQIQLETARKAKINSMITNLPELKCSTLEVTDVACVDKLKAQLFKELLAENHQSFQVYDELFGTVTIELKEINPLTGDIISETIYDNTPLIITNKEVIYNPVSVEDSILRKTSFGLLVTTFYESTN